MTGADLALKKVLFLGARHRVPYMSTPNLRTVIQYCMLVGSCFIVSKLRTTMMHLSATLLLLQSAIAQKDPVVIASGNSCPNEYVKLTTKKGCKSAMKQINLSDFQGTETDSDWPGGCYYCDGVAGCLDGTWFNRDSVGSTHGGATPICALRGWEEQQANPVVIADAGNDCPSGYVKLTTKKGCKTAMRKANLSSFQGTEDDSDWPGGCYHCDGVASCLDGTWFNEAGVGSAHGGATPICAVPGWEDIKDGLTTLFVGDSDIDYWDTSEFANSENVGVAGSVCSDVNEKLSRQLRKYKPARVVIVCGENDLWDQSVDDTFDNFTVAIGKIIDFGARAIYLGTKPEPETTSLHVEYQEYDAKIREYVNELKASDPVSPPPLVMVDVYPAFEDMGNPDDLYQRDKLHLSMKGYGYWNTWTQIALEDTSGCSRWKNEVCVSDAGAKFLRLRPH